MSSTKKVEADAKLSQRLLILAHLLALVAYGLALQFLMRTTGGTVFLFTTFGPLLVGACILILAGVALYRFTRSHSLFTYEIYQPGDVIFQEGEMGDCAYFIHTGQVEVVVRDP